MPQNASCYKSRPNDRTTRLSAPAEREPEQELNICVQADNQEKER